MSTMQSSLSVTTSLVTAIMTTLCLGQAQAAVSQYTDFTSFDSALTAAGLAGSTYGFPAYYLVGDPASVISGPATFTGLNPDYAVAGFTNDSYGISGTFYTHELFGQDQTNALMITFATPVRGFAFDSNVMNPPLGDPINPNNWPTSGNANVALTTSTGDVLNHSSPLFSNYGSDPNVTAPIGFNGFFSDTAFTSVTLSIPQGENFQITDFTLAPIPEPETYAMMLAGLGLLGFRSRRRPIG